MRGGEYDRLCGLLCAGAEEVGVLLSEEETAAFLSFLDLLLNENKRQNLTGILDKEEIVIKHFIDSLCCFLAHSFPGGSRVVDVGTGAGFPGIPLQIVKNSLRLSLLDSRKKRTQFLRKVVDELGLFQVEVICGRAEEVGQTPEVRESYDVAVSRAVAPLNVLSEYCLPLVRLGGLFLAMKGPEVDSELKESEHAIEVLGGEVEDIIYYQLPVLGHPRSIVKVRKTTETDNRYPRRAGIPAKRPL